MRITRRPSFQQQQQQQQAAATSQAAAAGHTTTRSSSLDPTHLGGCPPHKAISSTPNASNAASSIQFKKPLNQRLRLLPPLKSHRTRSL
jgi:hypothetical protein